MAILLAAIVFLLPLLILPGVLFHYDITPKILILCFGVGACLLAPTRVADGISALWARRAGRWLCGLAGAQALWFGLATALSSHPWFSLYGSNWRRMGLVTIAALMVFAILAAAQIAAAPGAMRTLLRAFAIAAIIASVYGILQYFDIDPLQNPAGYHAQAGDSTIVRPPGPLGQADYFAWWLAIAVFCAIALKRIETATWWRRAAIISCGLSNVATVLSGTRAAMLAVVAGFILLAALSGWKLRRRHAYAGLASALAFIVFLISPAGTRLRARIQWSGNEPLGGARPLLWRDSVRMAAARPLAGFGPETFSAEFPRYQSAALARLFPDFYHESPHNLALDAVTSAGIPALLLALGWVALGAFSFRKAPAAPVSSAFAAALAASCTTSLFTAAMAGPIFATLLVIAMLVASTPEDAPRHAMKRPIAFAVSAPIILGLEFFTLAVAANDFALARLQASSEPRQATAAYATAVRRALPGAGEDLYASRRLATLCGRGDTPATRAACVQLSFEAAARAPETADNPPNALYNLAMFSAERNDSAKVEASLRAAARKAPNWFKPHWTLARLLAATGRAAEARTEAAKAVDLDAGKDAEVSRTVAELTDRPR